MARSADPPAPLVQAAQALEDELRRFEKDVEDAARLRLNSEKNIGKAAHALTAASEGRGQLAVKVEALLAAINAAHGRMQQGGARMEARAVEIQARLARLEVLRTRTAEIGEALREVTAFAQGVRDARQILERLAPVEERIGRAFEEARAEEFEDVAHDIAAMRDMLAAMRRKLGSL